MLKHLCNIFKSISLCNAWDIVSKILRSKTEAKESHGNDVESTSDI